jgi:hypothetical protein
VEAEEFIASIWQRDAVNDRYDWLFEYDAGAVAI